MTTPTPKHRHAVALPIALLLALIPVLKSVPQLRASASGTEQVWTAGAGDQAFETEGVQAFLYAGGIAHASEGEIVVTQGTMLASADALLQVYAGGIGATGFHGAAHIAADAHTVTIAAITTPLLLRSQESRWFLPLGYQARWQVGTEVVSPLLQPLPRDFLSEQVQAVSAFPQAQITVETSLWPCASVFSFLQFSAAEERAKESCLPQVLEDLYAAITAADIDGVRAILADHAEVLRASSRLPTVLRAAIETPSMLIELLPLLQNQDLATLAYLHPDLRHGAWLSSVPASEEALVLQSLPASDLLPRAMPDEAMQQWQQRLAEFVKTTEEPVATLTEMFPSFTDAITRMGKLGYPDRHQQYIAALQEAFVALPYPVQELQDSIDALKTDTPVTEDIEIAPVAEAEPAMLTKEVQQVEVSLPPAEIVSTVREWLRIAGALFSTQLTIEPNGPTSAAVTNVVFSSADAEHIYSFVADVVAQEVLGITRDGEQLPYPMSFEAFGEWVSQ